MAVALNNVPVTNSTRFSISVPGGPILNPGDASPINVTFDRIVLNPGTPGARQLNQAPPANVNFDPGHIGFFESAGNNIRLGLARPGGTQTSIIFS
jgi:hypothetical protein